MREYDLIVVGGGISGITAALTAKENGVENILILDREFELGGILNCCVHSGFKNKYSDEVLTAPEYIYLLQTKIEEYNIDYKTLTNVIEIDKSDKIIAISPEGILNFKSKAIILAMGCRERPLGYKNILSHRCAGIIGAVSTLKLINNKGILPGKNVIILGSEDTAIFAARSLILEGANVKGIIETTNKIKAVSKEAKTFIKDFNINIMTNTRVTKVIGKGRVESVQITKLNDNKKPIKDTEKLVDCDTLILSIYMKPESLIAEKIGIKTKEFGEIVVDKSMQTSAKGIFACGTVTTGYETMDKVIKNSEKTAHAALEYLNSLQVI
ncbi:NAD(P)/FAD-dependent oxidoreductase [Clostridium senegalense]|uniref:NAD(P)/FAD-dependent oxidoreductase n=1 Tax=Clostridium senegalense TaxID=1465809 RepID=UPI001C0FC138|nr:NAD(P)/FAD-dependent oxidoreductase [Clostridium senegalense]